MILAGYKVLDPAIGLLYGDSITLNVTNFTNVPTVNVTDIDGNTVNVRLTKTTNTETTYSFTYSIECYNVKLRFTITSGTKTATVETNIIKDITFKIESVHKRFPGDYKVKKSHI